MMMAAYVRWLIANARLVLALVCLITIGLAAGIPRLRLESNIENNLPSDHPYIQTFDTITERFGLSDVIIVAFKRNEGSVFEKPFLSMIEKVTEEIALLPGATSSNILSLSARKVKDIRGTQDGLDVKPFYESTNFEESLKRNSIYERVLVSEDRKAAAIVLDYKPEGDPHYQKNEQRIRNIVEKHLLPNTQYGMNGAPIIMSALEKYTEKIALYFAIAILVIGLVHFEAFRSFQGLVLPLVTALLSVVWSTGALCWLGFNTLDPITAPTPILILAIAAGHAVQILKRYYEEFDRLQDNKMAVQHSLQKVGPVMLLAGSIATVSFLTLLFFDIPAIRDFGLYSALGVMAALTIEMTFIPALRSLMPSPKGKRHQDHALLDRAMTWLSDRLVRRKNFARVLGTICFLCIASMLLSTRIKVENSPKTMLPSDERAILEDEWIGHTMAGVATMWFLLEGKEDDMKRPDVLMAADRFMQFLEEDPGVGKAMGLPYFVKMMNRAMHEGQKEKYQIPLKQDLIAQYLFLYSMSGDPGDFDTYVTPQYDKAVITAFIKVGTTSYAEDLIARASAFAKENFPKDIRFNISGTQANVAAINREVVNGKIKNIAQIVLSVFVLTSLIFRSLAAGIFAVTPILVTVIVNFGIMGAGGIKLDVATAIVSALAIGIGADYAVYFISRLREELSVVALNRDHSESLWVEATRKTLVTTGKGVFFVSSAVALGYLTLCLSPFKPHFFMGLLVGTAMVISSVSAVVVLPIMALIFKPRFLVKSRECVEMRKAA